MPAGVAPGSVGSSLAGWRVGQMLQVLVLEVQSDGRAMLDLNGRRLQATSDLNLRPGERLTVEVERNQDPLVLRVTARPLDAAAIQTGALRVAIPHQTPLPGLLANLTQVAAGQDEAGRPWPPTLVQAARTFLATLPRPESVMRPEGLRKAIDASGLFLEARLAAARPATPAASSAPNDLKGALLRLAASLESGSAGAAKALGSAPADLRIPMAQVNSGSIDSALPVRFGPLPVQAPVPPTLAAGMSIADLATELRSQAEGALLRVQVQQLNTLNTAADPIRPLWSLEIPVLREGRTEVWSLRIEADGRHAGNPSSSAWSVSLAVDLEGLGPVHGRVSLHAARISATLWAERAATTALFRGHLQELEAALRGAGLQVARVDCFQGSAPGPAVAAEELPGLVDERA